MENFFRKLAYMLLWGGICLLLGSIASGVPLLSLTAVGMLGVSYLVNPDAKHGS